MKIDELKNKKILILGFGREGRDTFSFLKKLGFRMEIGISDKRDLKIKNAHFGKNYLRAVKDYDIIVKTPGIPLKSLSPYLKKSSKVTSQTDIFFDNFQGRIIGVTGTKGKSTTSSLIYAILKEAGIKACLAGNIGKPVLDFLFKKDCVFVYELSSHQLCNLKKSPNIAVFLNIYPDHLDYYKSFNEYVSSKKSITKYQTEKDYLIYNIEDPIVKKIAKKSKAKKIPIKGEYYDLNINAAKETAKIFNIPERIVSKAIKNFKFLEHRLEFAGKFKGIDFYNDSMSTIPQTTIFALNFFGDKVQTLILGGSDKNLDFKGLNKRIDNSGIKTLILFPQTGKKIWKGIQSKKRFQHFFVDDMSEAVKLCYLHTDKGKICLLSPGCASFTGFKDYRERGDLFKREVLRFKNRKKELL